MNRKCCIKKILLKKKKREKKTAWEQYPYFENSKCLGKKFEDLENLKSRPELPGGKIRLYSRELKLLSWSLLMFHQEKLKTFQVVSSSLTLVTLCVLSPPNTRAHTHTHTHTPKHIHILKTLRIDWIMLVSNMNVEEKKSVVMS